MLNLPKILPSLILLTALLVSQAHAQTEQSFELAFPGDPIVAYDQFGSFTGEGTAQFKFVIQDKAGFMQALGEGIYPNQSHLEDPGFQAFWKRVPKPLESWDYVGSFNPQDDFYAWIGSTNKDEGTKLFYIAEAFRRAGLKHAALKAYYALMVQFPKTVNWSVSGTYYWYAAEEALSRIRKICATHPELGITLNGAIIDVDRGNDNSPANDVVRVTPGRFEPAFLEATDPMQLDTIERRGGTVEVVKSTNGHWQLRKDGKPFTVRGVTYVATRVGESAHAVNITPWMNSDTNQNGQIDGMFDAWVDQNRNNVRDQGEAIVGDAHLLQEMGANTIRFYHGQDAYKNYPHSDYNKPLMRRLAKDYGIYFIMGDFLGAYTIGSGAAWQLGTDYTDPVQRERMRKMVRAMVLDHKDEPYVLMWLLGNENQYPAAKTNAGKHREVYAKFVNEIVLMIKELDPNHPVGICNLQDVGLKELAQFAPEVDIFGANVYSGAFSMGSIVQKVKRIYDRPLLFTEWGADAYAEGKGVDEAAQADYIVQNWKDINLNLAGNTGEGNVIGGVLFEWMDEWWKSTRGDGWGDPHLHNTARDHQMPFPDEWGHEEWFGLMGQGNGKNSPFIRHVRQSYFELQKLWKKSSESQS